MGLRLQPFEEANAAAADPDDVDGELKRGKKLREIKLGEVSETVNKQEWIHVKCDNRKILKFSLIYLPIDHASKYY